MLRIEDCKCQNNSLTIFLNRVPPHYSMSQVQERPLRGFSTQNTHAIYVIVKFKKKSLNRVF